MTSECAFIKLGGGGVSDNDKWGVHVYDNYV